MSNSPLRRSRRIPPFSETAISRRSVASSRSMTPAYRPIRLLLLDVRPQKHQGPSFGGPLAVSSAELALREASNSLDDVICPRLDAVRTGLHPGPSVLGMALYRTAVSPQRGGASPLETVEPLARELAVSVGPHDCRNPIARLQRGTDRNQHDTFGLSPDRLDTEPLGGKTTSSSQRSVPRSCACRIRAAPS